ncbi:MAG: fimbrial protein [Hyphomicrobiales bacterium]|nr:fimbrial protein [Hyphomicrobiales bacterium]
MAAPQSNDDEKPLDPEVERVRRKLLRFMIINLVILFVAFAAVIGGFIYKSSHASKRAAGQEAEGRAPSGADAVTAAIAIPAGARIVSQTLSGKEALFSLELADGSRSFLLYDLGAGRTLGTYAVKPE